MPTKTQPKPLSPCQREVVEFVRTFQQENGGLSPTMGELAAHFDVSRTTVFLHILAAERKGWLTKGREARSVRLITGLCPCCGQKIKPQRKERNGSCQTDLSQSANPVRVEVTSSVPPTFGRS